MQDISNRKIAVIGLGYVGLPLAVEFGKQLDTLGPGYYANITISTPNGYCVEPDPKCVADYAKFNLRADVRFWAGGKPRISKAFVKSSTVMAN